MADDNVSNVQSDTVTPPALKSTDTSTVKAVLAKEAAVVEPAPQKEAVKPEAAAEDVEVPGENAGEDHEDAPEADAPKPKRKRLSRWEQERLDRARRITAEETRRQVLEEVAAERQAQVTQNPESEPRKTLADFNFDEVAFDAYKEERSFQRFRQQLQREETDRQQAEATDQFKAKIDAFETRVGAGAWEDISTSPVNTDPAFKPLTDLFAGDEHDLDIALHLAGNLPEARRILALSPLQRAREIATLAEQITGTKAPERQAPLPKKLTNAPPPPKVLSGAGKPSVDINSPDLTTEQRIKLWKKSG